MFAEVMSERDATPNLLRPDFHFSHRAASASDTYRDRRLHPYTGTQVCDMGVQTGPFEACLADFVPKSLTFYCAFHGGKGRSTGTENEKKNLFKSE